MKLELTKEIDTLLDVAMQVIETEQNFKKASDAVLPGAHGDDYFCSREIDACTDAREKFQEAFVHAVRAVLSHESDKR